MRKASLLQVQGVSALSNAARYSDGTISKDRDELPACLPASELEFELEPEPGRALSTRTHRWRGKTGMHYMRIVQYNNLNGTCMSITEDELCEIMG